MGKLFKYEVNFELSWGARENEELSVATGLVLINLLTRNYSKH